MKPPLFWLNPPETPGIAAGVLWPLSCVWSVLDNRRWTRGAHQRLPVPVVCVGNINMGGTGKTPTVIEVVTRLIDLGKTPHIVSRGYGGTLQGPVQVRERGHLADEVGDEPLLLAAFAPCWVSKDRGAGAEAAVAAGADVIVLDDGMQNPSLAVDLTILVTDAQIGFGNQRVFPAGPLRQTVEAGLNRADLVLAIGTPANRKKFFAGLNLPADLPAVEGALEPLETGMDWQGLRALAFAGIGRPEKFFDTLRSLGADIVATHSFADHQKLAPSMLRRMEGEADTLHAQMVTTEKDAVRLPASYRQKVLTLPVRLQLEDPEPLVEALQQIFEPAKS